MFWFLLRKNKVTERFGTIPSEYDREQTRGRMPRIVIYHNEMQKIRELQDGTTVDEITWDDLEMDEVFFRINQTGSYIGEQVLYDQLHNLREDTVKQEQLEHQILFYQEHEIERKEIEKELFLIGKKEDDYYLPQFLMHSELWQVKKVFFLHVMQILLLGFVVGALLTKGEMWISGLIVVAVVNMIIYLLTKQKYEVFLYSLGSLKQLLRFCRKMTAEDYEEKLAVSAEVIQTAKSMERLSKKIIGWQTRKYAAFSGDLVSLLQDYLFGITLLDVSLFYHIMKVIGSERTRIMQLYEFAGQIDMGIAIASFRESLPCYCLPEMGSGKAIMVSGLVHPLVTNAVENDFILEHRALVTGANAAGKSTFLKALAINVVLAQTINTCTARKFSLPYLFVMTSMSLRDCVLTGESYYIREAKRMKQMLKASGSEHPKLILIDEILKGTNTEERLAAAGAILAYLVQTSDFVIVATHDMELVCDMGDAYENYFFESMITDTDIVFPYRIIKGQGGNSNAIGLLSLLEYPQEIIMSAKKRMRNQ